jgi:hypothetical protein
MTTYRHRPDWWNDPTIDAINRKPFVRDTRIAWFIFGVACGALAVIVLSWATVAP